MTERLWEEYEAFSRRDLSGHRIVFLFGGITKRLRAGRPREAVLAAGASARTAARKAVLKLTFVALIRAAERWGGLRVSKFETRQCAAVRTELNEEYTVSISHQLRASQPSFFNSSRP